MCFSLNIDDHCTVFRRVMDPDDVLTGVVLGECKFSPAVFELNSTLDISSTCIAILRGKPVSLS